MTCEGCEVALFRVDGDEVRGVSAVRFFSLTGEAFAQSAMWLS
jgi:hypothetical protein